MSATEEHHRRLLAITNALITETDSARLFRAVAAHLREWLPFASIGIAYFDAESEIFDRGMAITSDGAMQSIEPIPFRGTRLDGIVAAGRAALLTPEELEQTVARFVSLRKPGSNNC